MNDGLREFTGWARLKMLSGLQQNRQLVRMNDAIVAAELKKNFGDGIEMPKTEDDMLVGRDIVNPAPVVIMPQAPVQPQSSVPAVVAIIFGFILTLIFALAIAFCVWYTFLRTPAATPTATPVPANSEEWNVKFFDP